MTAPIDLIDRFYEFFRDFADEEGKRKYAELINRMTLEEKRSLMVNYEDLVLFDPHLARELRKDPEYVISQATEALLHYLRSIDEEYVSVLNETRNKIYVRFYGLPETLKLRDLRAAHVGKLVQVTGIVVRTTEIKPFLLEAHFECMHCGDVMIIEQENGVYNPPYQCANPNCNNKKDFRLLIQESKMIDWQTITLQERPEDLQPGASPRSIKCRLLDDIVDVARPGDRITLVAIVKTKSTDNLRRGARVTFDPWLDAISISSSSQEIEALELTEEEERKFREFAKNPYVHQRVMKAIAPMIHGLETEKEAIMLFLFGGVDKPITEGVKLRGQPNILLVGDPGVAKCVAPNTKIILPNGKTKRIDEIVNEKLSNNKHEIDDGWYAEGTLEILTMDTYGQVIKAKATRFWKRTAPPTMYKVTTKKGITITVTPTHPFFTKKGRYIIAKPAKQLKVGENIATYDPNALSNPAPKTIENNDTAVSLQLQQQITATVTWDVVRKIEIVPPPSEWVYDLEVPGTHNFIANGLVIHNSQLLRYTQKLAPRGIYTSGKGSSAAGLCVAGDSKIVTNKGTMKIKEIVEAEFEKGGLIFQQNEEMEYKPVSNIQIYHSKNLKAVKNKIDKVWKIKAPKTLIKIETISGKSIKTTPETRILVLDDDHGLAWRTAETIRPKDKVAVKSSSLNNYYPVFSEEDLANSQEIIRFYTGKQVFPTNNHVLEELTNIDLSWENHLETLDPRYFEKIKELLQTNYGLEFLSEALSRPVEELKRIFQGKEKPRFSMKELEIISHLISNSKPDIELKNYFVELFYQVINTHNKLLKTYQRLVLTYERDFAWEEVIKVSEEKPDEEFVYDLTVPRTHNFIVNDFVVHNTAAVIRDPDTGELTLEAGAIVLADRGIACLTGESTTILNGKITNIEKLFNHKNNYRARSNGEIIEVSELYGQYSPMGLSYNLSIENLEATRIRRKQYRGKLLRLVFKSGFELNLTPDHKLIDAETLNWKEAQEFKKGDYVLAPLRIPGPKKPVALLDVLSPEWQIVLKRKNNAVLIDENNSMTITSQAPLLEVVSLQKARQRLSREKQAQVTQIFNVKNNELITVPVITPEISLMVGIKIGISLSNQTIQELSPKIPHSIINKLQDRIKFVKPSSSIKDEKSLLNRVLTSSIIEELAHYFVRNDFENILSLPELHTEELIKGILIGATPSKGNDSAELHLFGNLNKDQAKALSYLFRRKSVYAEIIEKNKEAFGLKLYVSPSTVNILPKNKLTYQLASEVLKEAHNEGKKHLKEVSAISNTFGDQIEKIEEVDYQGFVYDLYVPLNHNYLSDGLIVHNCIDEFDKMNENDRTAIHEAMEQHSYHPSTEITLANHEKVLIGKFVDALFDKYPGRKINGVNCEILPIRDLSIYVYSTDFKQNFPVKIDRVSRHEAPSYFVQIIYDNGAKLTVTEEHPVFVYRNGNIETVPAINVKEGDYCPAPIKTEPFNHSSLEELNFGSLITNYNPLIRIPPNKYRLPLEKRAKYLAELFEKYGVEKPKQALIVDSKSLALDIKDFLLTFGILSRIKWKPNKGFEITIHPDHLTSFQKLVTGNAEDKQIPKNDSKIRLPDPILNYITQVSKTIGFEKTSLFEKQFLTAQEFEELISGLLDKLEPQNNFVNSPSNYQLVTQQEQSLSRANFLETIKTLSMFDWTRIVKVRRIPNRGKYYCKWVYDVTIEPTRNFYSNGLLLHNTVSIAKAGIVATLNARTGILAAANPRFGRYDRTKPAVENINLSPTIISRFDLIFIIQDIPDEDLDRKRARHILELHRSGIPAEAEADITPDFLKKYILYAKEHCHPVLSKEAAQEIEDFYVGMRKLGKESADGLVRIPITARQLEGIIRLAEARARVALRDQVTKDDARAAIELVKASLRQVGWDEEAKQFDVDLLASGIGARQRSAAEKVLDLVSELSGPKKEMIEIEAVLKRAKKEGMNPDLVKSLIERYIRDGLLYQPEPGKIRKP